ncbi:MAG: MFS transporter [Smithella sp.]
MVKNGKLCTFELLGLCLVTFIAVCNVTVFYNFFNYLQTLGISADLHGLLVGSYSFTAMVLYLLASPFLNPANAPRTMLLGMIVVALCGVSYLFVHSFWGLLVLRMINGCGQFLMGAGAMTLFVSLIPMGKKRASLCHLFYSHSFTLWGSAGGNGCFGFLDLIATIWVCGLYSDGTDVKLKIQIYNPD